MREKVLSLLLLPALVVGQCANPMPSGACCEDDGFFTEADPEACSYYYSCVEGTVTHKQCEPHLADGLPQVYDEVQAWCTYREDVDCGNRPCNDDSVCTTTTRTTPTTTTDCGHIADCNELGDGYFPDPYNCRKYWHCFKGVGEHYLCPDDENGIPEVYDTVYGGCNYLAQTQCGDRPMCDECDNNCGTTVTTTPDCGHIMDCTDLEDGWYPDPYNCRKYWHCSNGHGSHLMCETKEGKDLQYNPDNIQCDWPDRVCCGDRQVCDDCDGNCEEDDCSNGGGGDADCGPADHHPADICVGRKDDWYPDMFNCAKYWHCDAERGTHFLCPNGLVYEASKVQCDYPDRVDCGSRPTCDSCDENCQ